MLFLPCISNDLLKRYIRQSINSTNTVVKNYFYLQMLIITKLAQRQYHQKGLTYR